MPYLPEGAVGSGLPKARLIVDPDKILELKRRFEDRRDKVEKFLRIDRWSLTDVPPPGADPCSEATVKELSKNGHAALEAAHGFVGELTSVIDQLDRIANDYKLGDQRNASRFHPGFG